MNEKIMTILSTTSSTCYILHSYLHRSMYIFGFLVLGLTLVRLGYGTIGCTLFSLIFSLFTFLVGSSSKEFQLNRRRSKYRTSTLHWLTWRIGLTGRSASCQSNRLKLHLKIFEGQSLVPSSTCPKRKGSRQSNIFSMFPSTQLRCLTIKS
jgi:hypothetical protein